MARVLGVLSCITAVYAVMVTLYIMGAVANGFPAGVSTSVIIFAIWGASATLLLGGFLLMFGQRHSGLVLKPGSFTLAIIFTVMSIQSLRVSENLPLIWWLLLFPTLLTFLCAVGSVAVRKAAAK